MFNLMPWRSKEGEHPLLSLRRDMERVFEDFFHDFQNIALGRSPFEKSDFLPHIDVGENEKEIHVSAELPGMTEKDIEVTLENNILTIKGEKKAEEEHKNRDYRYMERRYGAFYRTIPIPDQVESEKIGAYFKNGILNIVLPKKEVKAKGTKIDIKT